ncbi:hypothetical protein PUMCH_002766 [Australozyma saopauloensis]|uniref:Nudix hydrolase domain-containing protein n=1 Tax=Australozyma saopauloensis TaxID=291208 RepID=A0AAX4HAR5_9ASCO|nr:hypothetical protein PUMCH_002766 [[Candida] saopauloensis]
MEKNLLETLRDFIPRNYQAQQTSIWHKVPVSRRLAVFVLLFLGRLGELRVVLTKRSSKLRNFPGHISLPGGKADNGLELLWMVSRREMSEEIGLGEDNVYLKEKFGVSIEHLTELPCYLSRTFLAVRPCVGFMDYPHDHTSEQKLLHSLELKINPGESSGIFLCPLRDFLLENSASDERECLESTLHAIKWGGIPWNLRSFTFPQHNLHEAEWLKGLEDLSASEEDFSSEDEKHKLLRAEERQLKKRKLELWGKLGSRRDSVTQQKIYDVWGLTANILHDLAELIYRNKELKNRELGEEELIWSIWNYGGQMRAKERSEAESRLILSVPGDGVSFSEVLPRTEFNRLKRLYKM